MRALQTLKPSVPHGSPLAEIAAATGSRGPAWCVLRVREAEADVLVPPRDRDAFDRTLEALGYRPAPHPPVGASADRDRRFHFRREGGRYFVVESVTQIAFDPWGGHVNRYVVPGLAGEVLADRESAEGIPKAEGPAGSLAAVLHESINRGALRREGLHRALVRHALADPDAGLATRLLGSRAARVLARSGVLALDRERTRVRWDDLPDFADLRSELVRAVRSASLRAPVAQARRACQDWVDRIVHRRLGRRQVAVALVGPDGVGKSTVAALLTGGEEAPRSAWKAVYNGRPKARGARMVARRTVKSAFFAMEWIADRLRFGTVPARELAHLAEIRLKRAEGLARALGARLSGPQLLDVAILDRGLADETLALRSPSARRRAQRLLRRALPGTESYSILITDDPQRIHARKGEKSPAEIERAMRDLRDAFTRTAPGAWCEVSASGRSPDEVAEAARRVVLDHVYGTARAPAVRDPHRAPVVPRGSNKVEVVQFFALGFPGPGETVSNGVHKALDGVAEALTGSGHDVTVLSQSDTEGSYERNGYTVRCFAGGGPLRLAPGLRIHLAGAPPGLFVLNGMFNPTVCAVARRLRRLGRPYVFAPHDPYNAAVFATRGLAKRLWWRLVERRMIDGAAAVQVLDRRHGALLEELGVRTPWFALPNGFRDEDLDEPHAPLEPHDGPARLFFLGRMDAHNKGLDLLLGAAAAVPAVRLTLQGPDWGDLDELVALARRFGLHDQVTFLGPDYGRSPCTLIAAHDVFCLPSRFEGFGLAALEAMLAERPVLISDVGGLAAIVGEAGCGIVVEPTPEAVAAGLLTMMDRRAEWTAMGTAGRDWAARRLTWRAIAADTWKEYARHIPES